MVHRTAHRSAPMRRTPDRGASRERRPPAPAVAAVGRPRDPGALPARARRKHDALTRGRCHVHGKPAEPSLWLGCPAGEAALVKDPICARLGLNDAWLAGLDRRAPGLFEVARQTAA